MKSRLNSTLLDSVDLKILSQLRKNARKTLTKIGRETGIPISSIFDKLRRMESIGVIKRHVSLLDTEKIGVSVRVILFVKTNDNNHNRELERWFTANSQVNNLTKINGEWSLAIEAWFKNIKDLEEFMDRFQRDFKGVTFSIHHILKDLKRESFLVDYE